MTEEIQTNKTKRTHAPIQVMFEILDNDGNVIPGAKFDKNIRVISVFKKVDEAVFELAQEHPNAVYAKF